MNYFQFKRFTVRQERCSMKVCTDSCLFGAWVAAKTGHELMRSKSILDIGTGTGLLSLMLAQKSNARIEAIDIDHNSFTQAAENFSASPWPERLQAFHADIKEWEVSGKYDLIISNPPFYENDLLPGNNGRSVSKHSTSLSLESLLSRAKNLLADDGSFAVLIPWHRTQWFESAALVYSLFVKEKLEVRQTPHHDYFRTMLLLQNKKGQATNAELVIKDDQNVYTGEFTELLKDYYLYL